jgi:EAL domain-containing protein (putative c-di-GMP-specific phosphodiesterase class I)
MRVWHQQFGIGATGINATHGSHEQPLSINVNLSAQQIAQPDLLRCIARALRDSELDASMLKLEITESILMGDEAAARTMLSQIKELGVQLCLDDFGTGFSSLSYLHAFPIDVLKIDRSFIKRLIGDSTNDNSHNNLSRAGNNAPIAHTIIALANSLGMSVVAEGVERPEQLAQLRVLDCGCAQGNFFSPAVPEATATELLRRRPRW